MRGTAVCTNFLFRYLSQQLQKFSALHPLVWLLNTADPTGVLAPTFGLVIRATHFVCVLAEI